VLLVGVSKVEIEIRNRSLSGLANGFDVLDDCGTNRRHQQPFTIVVKEFTNQSTLLPEPAISHTNTLSNVVVMSGLDAHVFRVSREANRSTSSHRIYCLERTTLQIPHDGENTQCYGSWMGQVERAICEGSPAVGSLQGRVRLRESGHMRLRDDEHLTWSRTTFASLPSSAQG